ncbi:hypothetical protein [Amphritea sp. HPY]|uniref:hypothetical protein n=1 Tax=Amphritea sp. HPY TaxID=3421652 RepID=UPI003D7CBBF0
MKWAIIVLIMMSLLGSMMWVMPSKRQKLQAELRLKASKLGFNVQMIRLTPPRAAGQVEPEVYMATAYRLPRFNLEKNERDSFVAWQIFRQTAVADEGLPEGWSWGVGERKLSEIQLARLGQLIAQLPVGVDSIESTPVHFSLFWDERGRLEDLEQFKVMMQEFIDNKF